MSLNGAQGRKLLIQEYHGIEVFAGSGRLAAQLRLSGLRDSVAVDHVIPKFCPCPMVNLMDESDAKLLFEMISNPFCIFVHVAPPCGAASRARLIQRRPDDPPPCRSDSHRAALRQDSALSWPRESVAQTTGTNWPDMWCVSACSKTNWCLARTAVAASCGPHLFGRSTPVTFASMNQCLTIVAMADCARRKPVSYAMFQLCCY